MTASFPPPASSVGRFTGLVLTFVVFVCLTMIAGTVYLKYQLDRAESVLAAPDDAVGSDQDLLDRLRRDLGFGGFLGLAQAYVATHDASGLAEMKAQIKSADDIVGHLPEKTPPETRHDLVSIVAAYDNAMQKLSGPAGEATELTAADLAPLYAALPILEARVTAANAETRLAAQNRMHFWGMLLTLVSWCSLIIAAACAAGIYLAQRDRHGAPMRALAQSIQNMARGDMRTAIWGIERQDMIGELARAVDIARYHFGHLPDVSVLSEQGPVRMRFEGGSRSLFEAMMKAISRDSETIRDQAATLGESVRQQKESVALMTEKVESVLQNVVQRGQNGDAQIKQAVHEMTASAENLKNAHAHAADQLNRMLPFIQERVHSMAEIASITGKQVAQSLQSLAMSDTGLKVTAEQARESMTRLTSTADDLGERMFGAINLIQASGKVLAETAEKIRDSADSDVRATFDPAVLEPMAGNLADHIDERLQQVTAHLSGEQSAAASVLADIKNHLENLQQKIAQQAALPPPVFVAPAPGDASRSDLPAILAGIEQLLASRPPVVVKDGPDATLAAQNQQIVAALAKMESATTQAFGMLQDVQDRLKTSPQMAVPDWQNKVEGQWYQVTAQIEAARVSIEKSLDERVAMRLSNVEYSIDAARSIMDRAERLLASPPVPVVTLPPELMAQVRDQWYQVTAQIEAARTGLAEMIAKQTEQLQAQVQSQSSGRGYGSALSKSVADYNTERQIEQQTQILTELVATMGILDAHVQQITNEMHATAR